MTCQAHVHLPLDDQQGSYGFMSDDFSVAALVNGAKSGDKHAWDTLIERFAPLVWRICRRYRLTDADTADVGQTVWLRLIEQLPALREPAALPGWLVTTTQRECGRVRQAVERRGQQERPADEEIPADPESTATDRALLWDERNHALRHALDHELSSRCRQLLLSLFLQDPPLTYKEISARLDRPVGSIGPTRSRCLDQLRNCPTLKALIVAESGGTGGGEGDVQAMVER